jgi:hypothetical protein
MQRILAFLTFLLIPGSMLLAQDAATTDKVNSNATPPPIVKPARDFVMLDFLYTNWATKPDTVKTKGFGFGINASLCYDFPIKKTHLSFAAGLGINVSEVYLSGEVIRNTDTNSAGTQVRFIPDTANFKRYKFVTTYIQAPFELRYFSNINNRNKGFKAAIGLEIGTLLGSDAKATSSVNGTVVKYKIDTKRYVTPWNFAATARIGYANFSLFGSYNLTNVFKENAGPPITPFSVGLCLTGL